MPTAIDLLIGVALAAATVAAAQATGLDRERAFWPAVLVVIAALYVAFGLVDGRLGVVGVEMGVAVVFVGVAVVGARGAHGWLAAGYLAHSDYDLVHSALFVNAGVPAWWPEFCIGYDVAIAGYLLWRASHPEAGAALST